MNEIEKLYFDDIVRAYALKNAIAHNGKADEKKVLNAVIGHFNNQEKLKESIKIWEKTRLPILLKEKEK